MKHRFVILVDDSTAAEQNAVTKELRTDTGLGMWHHFSDLWLVIDANNRFDAATLRDKVRPVVHGKHVLVIGLEQDSWTAFGIPANFEWLKTQWDRKDL